MNIKSRIGKVIQRRGHCGPASLEMLYSFYGIEVPQDEIAQACDVRGEIEHIGTRVDQLNKAVETLTPNFILVAKYNSSIDDLFFLTNVIRIPAIVEWQGIFVNSSGQIFEEGHYSVVTDVNELNQEITMVDPDKNSALIGGKISFEKLKKRWWDVNEVPHRYSRTGNELIKNSGLTSTLLPKRQAKVLIDSHFHKVSIYMLYKYHVDIYEKHYIG